MLSPSGSDDAHGAFLQGRGAPQKGAEQPLVLVGRLPGAGPCCQHFSVLTHPHRSCTVSVPRRGRCGTGRGPFEGHTGGKRGWNSKAGAGSGASAQPSAQPSGKAVRGFEAAQREDWYREHEALPARPFQAMFPRAFHCLSPLLTQTVSHANGTQTAEASLRGHHSPLPTSQSAEPTWACPSFINKSLKSDTCSLSICTKDMVAP